MPDALGNSHTQPHTCGRLESPENTGLGRAGKEKSRRWMFCGIWCPGGRGEIRTLGTRLDTPPFQGGTLNHSATLPVGLRLLDPESGYLDSRKGVSANEEIAHSTDLAFFSQELSQHKNCRTRRSIARRSVSIPCWGKSLQYRGSRVALKFTRELKIKRIGSNKKGYRRAF